MALKESFWEVGSGLLDKFSMLIKEAWIAKDDRPNVANPGTVLKLRGEAIIDDEVVDPEQTIIYGMGDGWKPAKNGREAVNEAGKMIFNKNSNIGRFVAALIALPGLKDAMEERGYQPFHADAYQGLDLFFERKEFTFTDRKTGEVSTYEVLLPTAFNGIEDVDGVDVSPDKGQVVKPAGRGRGRAKAEEAAEPEEAPKAASSGRGRGRKAAGGATKVDNSQLRDAITLFAADFEDDAHAEFVSAAFDTNDPDGFPQAEELSADAELSADVLDQNGSIWKASREIVPE